MSLFPAYNPSTSTADRGDRPLNSLESKRDNSDFSWLNNTSYSGIGNKPNQETEHSSRKEDNAGQNDEGRRDNTKKQNIKKNKKYEKTRKSSRDKKIPSTFQKSSARSVKPLEDDQFYEDRKQEKGNFLVDTLYRPAIPRYDKYSHYFKAYKRLKKQVKKNKKSKRYFYTSSDKKGASAESNDDTYSKEEELTKITEDFNKKLAENSRDIDMWLEYVHFQDTVLDFEKTFRNNPIGGSHVTSERKLAILERALQSNPASERLLATRLQLLEHIWPPDQVADECSRALIQDPGCVPLWRTLIRTCRNNMARCVVPAVLQVFMRAVSRLGQLRVHRPPATIDKDILTLVVESGLFLQQAGLWEQLLMLIQMYLGLNLTASGQFTLPAQPQDDKLREQEDTVLGSGLPLSVLWLRIEKLRAAYYYLPMADCESDPQRVVFSEDLAGLLQPVMSGELRLQLVASVFVLLKVPVLPTRHTTLECLNLTQIPSAINNVETLLAAAYPTDFSSLSNCRYLSGSIELVSEPQFLREAPGQAEFLITVVSLLQQCAELLPPADAITIHVWLLRLYVLLCRLHTLQLGSVPLAIVKQARSHAKQLLKQPQFRDNLLLYSEYALIEKASGDLGRACKVLETAAALRHSPPSISQEEPDVHHLVLCRRLVECLLVKDYTGNRELAVKMLTSVLPCEVPVGSVAIQQCINIWQLRTTTFTDQWSPSASQPLTLASALAPQLLVEWLTCHALFLYITCSVWDATALLQRYIEAIPHSSSPTLGSAWIEQLYEVLTGLLYLHTQRTRTSFALLRSTLVKALKSFPNNLTLLNTLACLETGSGGGGSPLWKLVSYFPTSVPLARLVLVFVVRHRISVHTAEDTSLCTSGGNYLKNLLKQLAAEVETRECPLVWRLYLQLVAATESGAEIKATFYQTLQACPWVKAVYLDAVKFLPEELPEVQDLLIEKELRLHTTPEELEILRD